MELHKVQLYIHNTKRMSPSSCHSYSTPHISFGAMPFYPWLEFSHRSASHLDADVAELQKPVCLFAVIDQHVVTCQIGYSSGEASCKLVIWLAVPVVKSWELYNHYDFECHSHVEFYLIKQVFCFLHLCITLFSNQTQVRTWTTAYLPYISTPVARWVLQSVQ